MDYSVPIHGNYHGYYNKRQALRDPRLSLLPLSTFASKRVFTNFTWTLTLKHSKPEVTFELAAQLWGALEVIGVDIDDTLIRAAWKRRRALWSQQRPSGAPCHSGSADSEVTATERTDERCYFPVAFEHLFGPLPIPSNCERDASSGCEFPHNVSFRTTDWLKDGAVEDRQGYDIVLAFSVTKWIHLNDGDVGVEAFFRRVFSVLRPGGVFVLEPQDWSSYAKTRRMNPILKERSETLQLRPDDFETLLLKIGFSNIKRLGEVGKGGFSRSITLYRKPDF